MAIREYGESLLRRQSLKRDQRERKERRDARRASRDELAVKAVSWLGNEALGMARNSIERKTNDYINSTGAFDTKIKLNKAGDILKTAVDHQTNYTGSDLTDQEYFIRLTADEIIKRTKVEDANYFKPGTEEEATSILMKRPGVIAFAKQRAEDNKYIINQGNLYTKGKQALSVDNMIKREMGTNNFLSYGWKKLTGTLPSDPEIINEKLNKLTQVVAADSILAREIKRVQNRSAKLNDQKTTDLANSIIGRFSVLEEKEFKDLLKQGEDITDISVKFTNLGNNGHAKTITTSVNTGLKDASGKLIIKTSSETKIVKAQENAETLANVFAKDVTSMKNIDETATPKGSNNATHVAWRIEKERIKNLNLPKLEEQQLFIESAFVKEWAPVGGISADTSGLDIGIGKEVLERNLIILQDIRTAMANLTDAKAGTLEPTKPGQTQKEFITELDLKLQGHQKNQQDSIAVAVKLSSAERENLSGGDLTAARQQRKKLVEDIVTSGVQKETDIIYKGIKYPITTDPVTQKRSITVNGKKFNIGEET
tara:strand:- start:5901 stop:7523 length:1623 start_codon:yes stop_codon:yes gene_type:complete